MGGKRHRNTHTHAYIHRNTHTHTYIHRNTHTHTYIHRNTYTHTNKCVSMQTQTLTRVINVRLLSLPSAEEMNTAVYVHVNAARQISSRPLNIQRSHFRQRL